MNTIRRVAALACLGAACALSGCLGGVADALNKTADTLAHIGEDLANGASDFNSTAGKLTDVLKDLPHDAGNELRSALEQAAGRATQAAGIEARCTVDFARRRIGDDISYLVTAFRAKAKGDKVPERPTPTPLVCQPQPASVHRDRLDGNATVVFDGYDLFGASDGSMRITAALERQNHARSTVDILSRNSPYQISADLSRVKQQLTPDVVKLVLLWNTQVVSEVGIEQASGPVRKTITADLSTWGPFFAGKCPSPRNPRADKEFDGHGPKVDWSVSLRIVNQAKLEAVIKYHAIEWDRGSNSAKSDFTEACGEWHEVVYSAPAGQRILRIVDDATDSGSFIDTSSADNEANGSLYRRYVLGGDGSGSDVGVATKIQAPIAGHVQVELEIPAH